MSLKSDKKEYEFIYLHEDGKSSSEEIFDEVFLALGLFSDARDTATIQEEPSSRGNRSEKSPTKSVHPNQVDV